MMEKNNLYSVGGFLSVLVGLSYLALGITFFITPVEQLQPDVGIFMESMAENPTARVLNYISWAMVSIFALGAVPAISERVRQGYEGWIKWTSMLAILGFSVVAVANLKAMLIKPLMADAYVSGDPMFKTIIPTIDPWLLLDPQGWLGGVGVGLWILVVSLIGFKKGISKVLNIVGILGAVSLFLGVIGTVLQNPLLNGVASGVGGLICGPIWFIWFGLLLIKQKKKNEQELQEKVIS